MGPLSRIVFGSLCALLVFACRKPADDAQTCPGNEFLVYSSPGCDGSVRGHCVNGIPPCATQYCSCGGATVIGCGGTTSPFKHEGPCAALDASTPPATPQTPPTPAK